MLRRVLVLMTLVGLSMSMMTGCRHKPQPPEAPVTKTPETMVRPATGTEPVPDSLMPKVYFDFDKYEIRADQTANADKCAEYLKTNASVKVRVEGNCDERGTAEYNMALGEKRAETLATYLAGHGVAKDRVTILTRGKENPVDPGKTEAAYAKNRRDEYFYTAK